MAEPHIEQSRRPAQPPPGAPEPPRQAEPPRQPSPSPTPAGAAPAGVVASGVAPHSRTWFFVIGGLLLVAGILAFLFPVISTLATTVLLAWLLVLGGIVQIIHAFGARAWSGALWNGLIGLAWLVGGLIALIYPLVGTVSFTIALAAIFIVQGIFALAGAVGRRDELSPGWRIFSGAIAIIAGVLVWLGLPSSALWALGILAGANFVATGISYLACGAAMDGARKG